MYEIVIADPAKNITVFALNPVEDRAEAARTLLGASSLKAEQVGFVMPPKTPGGLWRLEMMGGEFCGNAARSFGLFVARKTGLSGRVSVRVEISGASGSLPVLVDTDAGTASVAIPKPSAEYTFAFEGQPLRAYQFEGITHIIAPDIPADRDNFFAVKRRFESCALKKAGPGFQALGVLFYDRTERFMRPCVYVVSADSLVFESSCGSGSAALGIWLHEDKYAGEFYGDIAQPGGSIEVRLTKRAGEVREVSIGGRVLLGEAMRFGGTAR
ncbi:MAG: hypothetical protein LBG87_09135 [Spirochaetaceae bacterium]|jgi:diaminopimelate epimerase|nr:hypothetical protein [Spirochaetaceae bacterium]